MRASPRQSLPQTGRITQLGPLGPALLLPPPLPVAREQIRTEPVLSRRKLEVVIVDGAGAGWGGVEGAGSVDDVSAEVDEGRRGRVGGGKRWGVRGREGGKGADLAGGGSYTKERYGGKRR